MVAMDKKQKAEYMRKWRDGNVEYAEYMRRYRQEHRDKVYADRRAWRQRNRKRNAELASQWADDNPLLAACGRKAHSANRRFPGKLDARDVLEVIERSGYKCHWCGKENLQGADLTLEHLKPVNDKKHLAIACRSCNSSHKAQHPHFKPLSEEEKAQRASTRLRKWYLDHQELQRQRQREYEARITLRAQGLHVEDSPRTKAIKWNLAHSDIKPVDTPIGEFLHNRVKSSMARYPGELTINDVREIIDREQQKCHWCGKEKLYGDDLTLEHLGDTNAKETIVLACRACNAQKLQVVK